MEIKRVPQASLAGARSSWHLGILLDVYGLAGIGGFMPYHDLLVGPLISGIASPALSTLPVLIKLAGIRFPVDRIGVVKDRSESLMPRELYLVILHDCRNHWPAG